MAEAEAGVPAASTSQRTSLVTVLESEHGRQRRMERKIGLRDLQAAVRHGVRTPGFPCPRTGEGRWKYTFAGVVYVTDSTSRKEITSWPAPALGLDVETVEVSAWPYSDEKVANRNGGRSGGRSLTGPFRDARRFPSTRL
jgi:hypothetical protein